MRESGIANGWMTPVQACSGMRGEKEKRGGGPITLGIS